MAPKKKKAAAPAAAEEAKDAASPAEDAAPAKKKAKKAPAKKKAPAGPIPRSPLERAAPPDGAKTLKVVSVNVAGLRAVLDEAKGPEKRDALAALVASEAPDVLCLNEHKLKDEDVDEAKEKLAALLPAYSRAEFTCSGPPGKKGYSGVAMLFRDGGAVPADAEVTRGMPGVDAAADDDIVNHEGRLLTLALPGTLPAAGTGASRRRRVPQGGRPVAVIGDLNCCHAAADMHNMHARPNFEELNSGDVAIEDQYAGLSAIKKQAGLTVEERVSFTKLLDDAGLVDSFRRQHPAATGVFTYYSQRVVANRPANRGLRLDYVLATPDLLEDGAAPALVDSFVLSDADTPQLADHTPVGATFVLE
ncbi:procollagen-lysine 5-dioxygenase [Aureococcus anophagefferens]|nr:procollagen-lysine 5-dioxygenase [Aureococcus anophagefferens]